jgi:hypothetical protein
MARLCTGNSEAESPPKFYDIAGGVSPLGDRRHFIDAAE